MPYSPQTWVNGSGGGTPLSAARLQHIENGIQTLEQTTLPATFLAQSAGSGLTQGEPVGLLAATRTLILAPTARGNRVAFAGDSITVLNGNGVDTWGDNWNGYFCARSLGGAQWGGAFGAAGYRIDQIRDTIIPQITALSASRRPNYVVILGGTNDAGASTALATSLTALNDICDTLLALGVMPVLCTIPPRGDGSTPKANAEKLNAAIAITARRRGLHLLDFYSVLVDRTTGGFISGYAIADNIHPSAQGFKAMATYALTTPWAASLPKYAGMLLPRWTGDITNLVRGGVVTQSPSAGGGGSGSAGDAKFGYQWTSFDGDQSVYSYVASAPGDDIAGNWQQVAIPAVGGSRTLVAYGNAPTVGDRLQWLCRFQTTGVEAAAATYTISCEIKDGGGAQVAVIGFGSWTVDIADGLLYGELTTPASGSGLNVQVSLTASNAGGSTATWKLGSVVTRSLTALGLA